MRSTLSADGVRRAEARAVARGVTLETLMSRAGAAVADEVARRQPTGRVVVVTGKGNNGGDGWVAAVRLAALGRDVEVVSLASVEELAGPAANAASEAIAAGVGWEHATDGARVASALLGASVVVDAVFGIGLGASPREPYATAIDAIGGARTGGAEVVAVDIPSGVDSDTGSVPGAVVSADATVTFSAPKTGLILYPGAKHTGELTVADIGLRSDLDADGPELWDPADYRALLPVPERDAHKNARGRVLIVAGSRAYPGAAALAAMGAQRMGAGYVTLAVPESILPTMHAKLTSTVCVGLPENPSRTFASKVAEAVLDLAREHDAVVAGPGLTVAHGAVLMVRRLVRELTAPLVLDADGLNALVDALGLLDERDAVTVLTPHPGELARLLGVSTGEIQSDRLSYGARLAGQGIACVLKGARTVVSAGGRQMVVTSGGPALATAGTGDVLAGMMGALLAQGLAPMDAGALAAYLHGRAGDLAAARMTETCVVAEDVPGFLAAAVKELEGDRGA